LGLDDLELPETVKLDQVQPKNIPDSELEKIEQPGVSLATVRLYIEKVSPFNLNGYSKNAYLDEQIERLFLSLENQRTKKYEMIQRVKKNVALMEEYADVDMDDLDDEERKELGLTRKTKKETNKKPMIELTTTKQKVSNLKNYITKQTQSLKKTKPLENWIPSSGHIEVDKSCFEPYTEDR
jgi:hypothetical protein